MSAKARERGGERERMGGEREEREWGEREKEGERMGGERGRERQWGDRDMLRVSIVCTNGGTHTVRGDGDFTAL